MKKILLLSLLFVSINCVAQNTFSLPNTFNDTVRLPNVIQRSRDTSNFKLGVFDASGNLYKMYWPTSGISAITADNGLTASTSTNVQLGGTLTGNTTIAGGAFGLILTGTSATVSSLAVSNNSIGSGSVVNISSTSTAAASNTQKVLNISLSGANATSSQSTYGAYISNTHTGTGALDYGTYSFGNTYGVYGQAINSGVGIYGDNVSTGSGAGYGVFGASGSGQGVAGNASSGIGVWGVASSGIGVKGESSGGNSIAASTSDASTNTILENISITRSSGGAPTNGIGQSVSFYTQSTNTMRLSNQLITKWTDATDTTRTSQFIITGVNSGTTTTLMTLDGNANATFGTTNSIVGTATNNNAVAGNIGEYVSGTIALGSAVTLTTATTANVTSISLTAGDWDVTGVVDFDLSGSTVSDFLMGTSTTSATLGAQDTYLEQALAFTSVTYSNSVPTVRYSLASTTTIYLVTSLSFTGGTAKAYGTIRARRVR